MGLLQTVHQRGTWRGPFTLSDPALAELYGYGAKTLAGPVVTELLAFTVAAFWDGVNQQSSDVAKLPLNLLKVRPGGGSDHYIESKTYKLLKMSPNPETRSLTFRRTIQAHALVYGNGYAEIVRDMLGRPTALWILHPNRVRPYYEDRQQPGTRKPLRYQIDGSDLVLNPSDVIHIAGLSDDGVMGFNLVSVAREALGLALASQQFASAFFGNGTRFGGIMTSDVPLDEDQKKEIREAVEAVHAKADKAFRMLVLGAGFKFTETGVKPNEAQMKEIRDQQVTEIARFLNMPLHRLKLNTPGAVSYASVEMADLDYYKGPILTWTRTWEEELDAKLVPSLEWNRQYFKHNTNAFLRGDIKSRYDALGIARDKGIINADEWRDLEDMNPQPGGQGQLYLVQSAQVPLEKLAELVDSQIKKNTAPPPAPAPPSPAGGDDDEAGRALATLIDELRAAYASTVAQIEASIADSRQLDALERDAANLRGQIGTLEVLQAEKDTRIRETQQHVDDIRTAGDVVAAEIRESSALKMAAAARDLEIERHKVAAAEQANAALEAQSVRLAADVVDADGRAHAADAARTEAETLVAQLTEERSALVMARDAAVSVAEDAQAAAASAEEARLQAIQIKAEAERDQAEAQALLREAEAALDTATGEKLALEADKAAAVQLAGEAEARAGAADMARQRADEAVAAATTVVCETKDRATTLEGRTSDLEAQLAEAQRLATEAGDSAAAARSEVEAAMTLAAEADAATSAATRAAVDAQGRADALAQRVAECEAQMAAVERQLGESGMALVEARGAHEMATTMAAEVAARLQQSEAERTTAQIEHVGRLAAVLGAHRALVEDVVKRLVEREVDRATSRNASPQKLRAWMATFYPTFGETFVEAILPAVRVHVAWQQSTDDPRAVAQAMAARHVEESIRQLMPLLEADEADFQVSVQQLLTRWEKDRPTHAADALLADEIAYLRGLQP